MRFLRPLLSLAVTVRLLLLTPAVAWKSFKAAHARLMLAQEIGFAIWNAVREEQGHALDREELADACRQFEAYTEEAGGLDAILQRPVWHVQVFVQHHYCRRQATRQPEPHEAPTATEPHGRS